MTNSRPSADALKELLTAIPSVDEEGNVHKWFIKYRYAKDDLEFVYETELFPYYNGEEIFSMKPPEKFTRKELDSLLPFKQWDSIFDSQYNSIKPKVAAPKLNVMNKFDIKKLN